MIYLHYCKSCCKIHLLNGHRIVCPRCHEALTELTVSYMDFIQMNIPDRDNLTNSCQDENTLKSISTTYTMHKYSKRYQLELEHTESEYPGSHS